MAVELRRSLSTPANVNAGSGGRLPAQSSQNQRPGGQSSTAQLRADLSSTTSLPPLKSDLNLSDRTLFAVYCFFKNFVGAAGNNNAVAIDNKIEQAMDLVKSHLMFAVREEVEVLKEKIAELMDRINQLEVENSILKANASPETIELLPKHASSTASSAPGVPSTQSQAPIPPTSGQPP